MVAITLAGLTGCNSPQQGSPPLVARGSGGDPRAGLSTFKINACAACHAISNVAVGSGGPVLDGEGNRHDAAWLRAMLPSHVHAVGARGLLVRDREDLVAYLISLR